MGLFKNIIHEKQPSGPDHLILRQSKRILYRLLLIGAGVLLLYLLVLFRGVTFLPSWDILNILGVLVQGVLGVLFLIVLMVLFGYVISLMLNYFYTMYLVDDSRVAKVKYGANFESEVVVIDLTKVIYSYTDQSLIMQSTCNYGDIHLHLVSDDEIILENIPKPKECAMEIESLQKYVKEKASKPQSSNQESNNKEETNQDNGNSSNEVGGQNDSLKKQIRGEVIAEMKEEIKQQVTQEIKQEIEEDIAEKLLSQNE